MKRFQFAVLFGILSLPLSAQPVVTSITPQSGPASGGTEVTITGSKLLPDVQCIVPCPATVTFGDVTVTVSRETDTMLTVITPPHLPGTVDVKVNVAAEEPVVLPDAFTFNGGAEEPYEAVLFPVYFNGTIEGVQGTRWQTDLWLRNNGSTPARLAPWPCPPDTSCPAVVPLTYTLEPDAHLHNLSPFFGPATSNPGFVLFVSRDAAADVGYSLRFADTARNALNAGTDMPVIREKDLRLQPLHLLNVPMTDAFRVLLRIYDTAHTSSRFRVTFYAYDASSVQRTIHSIELIAITDQQGIFRTRPALAQFNVSELLLLDQFSWPETVHMEIVPLTPGSRYWAFASLTNNDTQLVTLVTPQ